MTQLTGIRGTVFSDRYALKNELGESVEKTPEDMWQRVARGIAANEKKKHQDYWADQFYKVLLDFKFVPGGRILSGAGTGYQVTYFNCFVIPSPKDSREGILESLKQLVEIQSRSGGVGLNLSSLRPRGARVRKVNGTSSGPVTWAGLFSYATHDVVQQGGTRRGATMLMLWDWHPDVEEFITVKQDLSKINGANLSVCVSDAFMEAVKNNRDWDLVYPDIDDPLYEKMWNGEIEDWRKLGGKIKVCKTVKAVSLWNLICEAAWRSAEPGLHFLERSNKRSNTFYFERLVATNPCGEQPLGAWAVCNLGAMNLAAYVVEGNFNYDAFAKDVKIAIRFLDNVIDQTYYFFPENEKCAKDIRRTGLGIMGLGDALIKMKIRYGSEESLAICEKIFRCLRDNAYEAASDTAAEKGSFPKFDKEKYLQGYHVKELPKGIQKKIATQGIRNAVLLTIAPTGTTSLVAGVSSGIEPVYEFSFVRKWRGGEQVMYHPLYEDWKNAHPHESRPDYFVSANDLTPLDHVCIQSIAQKFIDSSISKTVNAPSTHTVEDVKTLYMAAYDMELKGVTYMRDGSRAGVLSRISEKKETAVTSGEAKEEVIKKAPRPMVLAGHTYQIETPVGIAYVTLNTMAGNEPLEMFINIGKAGSDVAAMAEALGRIVSLNLRMASPLSGRERMKLIFNELIGIGGSRHLGFGQNRVRSLPDAIAKAIAKHLSFPVRNGETAESRDHHGANGSNGEVLALTREAVVSSSTISPASLAVQSQLPYQHGLDLCPECGQASMAYEEGCAKCYSCGHSEC